ncbi:MAG: hypothetical protein QG560_795 [Campylobacterota bacterium]|nr:hypothetical protein [Campylobacterota bacterium]
MRTTRKNAIALLVTIFFIMAITIGIGIGLGAMKSASQDVEEERFMFQTALILDDILSLLSNYKEIDALGEANANETFARFLNQTQLIPFKIEDMKVLIQIRSARGSLNINSLQDDNATLYVQRAEHVREYLKRFRVQEQYIDFLRDGMSKIKEDASYHTRMFYDAPYLYRDHIASMEHLEQINEAYTRQYRDTSLEKADLGHLFSFNKDRNTKIDLNYATQATWMLMLGIDEESALSLVQKPYLYGSYEDLPLSDEKKAVLQDVFETSFFEPFIEVQVAIGQGNKSAKIVFEYDLKNKKGSNFVYEI